MWPDVKLAGQWKSIFIRIYSSLVNALPWLALLTFLSIFRDTCQPKLGLDWNGQTFCGGRQDWEECIQEWVELIRGFLQEETGLGRISLGEGRTGEEW